MTGDAFVARRTPTGAPRVVAIGEAMLLAVSEHLGPLQLGSRLQTSLGGAELNVAVGVSRLGQRADWIGVLGDDIAGDLILGRLRAEGVGTDHIRRAALRTGLMLRERRTALGSHVHYWRHQSAGSLLQPDDLADAVLGPNTIVHLTGITPALSETAAATARAAVDRARSRGAMISFDVNYRTRLWPPDTAAEQLVPFLAADLVIATPAEAALLLGRNAPAAAVTVDACRELAGGLQEAGAADVIVKCGAYGAVLRTRTGGSYHAPAPAVPVVDTVGAGDAFVAGYLTALLTHQPAAAALQRAVTAGAYAVTAPGDCDALPHLTDLTDLTDLGVADGDRR